MKPPIFQNNHSTFKYKIKELLFYFYSFFKQVDEYVINLDTNITSSVDFILDEMKISLFLKNILKGKQLQFMFLLSINLFLIFNDFSEEWPFLVIKLIYYCNLMMLIIVVGLIYSTDPGTLKKNEDFETYIISQQPLIKQHICLDCNVLKCLRSLHCPFCKRCVLKYELHSRWFNRCIGSKNSFIYSVFLILCTFHYIIMYYSINNRVAIFALQNFYFRIYRFFFFHLWLVFMSYLTLKMYLFMKSFVKGVCNNMTYSEKAMWKRIPYLWLNMSKQYFNPFDKKSSLKNIKESLYSFVDPPLDNKQSGVNEMSDLIETNQIKLNLSNIDEDNTLVNIREQKKNDNENQIKQSTSQYGFIASNKECYYSNYHGDQETYINWTKYRVYTLMDINNSPMKRVVEESLKIQKVHY